MGTITKLTEDETMTKNFATLNETELNLICGGQASPSASSREGGSSSGDVQVNSGATGIGDPASIF
jgi:hypothetical protein